MHSAIGHCMEYPNNSYSRHPLIKPPAANHQMGRLIFPLKFKRSRTHEGQQALGIYFEGKTPHILMTHTVMTGIMYLALVYNKLMTIPMTCK